jgi:hypothetical protein
MRHHPRTLACVALVYVAAISTAAGAFARPLAPPPSKVTLCHVTHGKDGTHLVTILVAAASAPAHIRNQGDVPGRCPTGGGGGASTAPGKTPTPPGPAAAKGKAAQPDPEPTASPTGHANGQGHTDVHGPSDPPVDSPTVHGDNGKSENAGSSDPNPPSS